jgi:hypothetical protein
LSSKDWISSERPAKKQDAPSKARTAASAARAESTRLFYEPRAPASSLVIHKMMRTCLEARGRLG